MSNQLVNFVVNYCKNHVVPEKIICISSFFLKKMLGTQYGPVGTRFL